MDIKNALPENNNPSISEAIDLPPELFKKEKLSYNARILIETIAKYPQGILSRHLAHRSGISNKADTLKPSVKEKLAKYGFKIQLIRIERQWLWKLIRIKDVELTEQRDV